MGTIEVEIAKIPVKLDKIELINEKVLKLEKEIPIMRNTISNLQANSLIQDEKIKKLEEKITKSENMYDKKDEKIFTEINTIRNKRKDTNKETILAEVNEYVIDIDKQLLYMEKQIKDKPTIHIQENKNDIENRISSIESKFKPKRSEYYNDNPQPNKSRMEKNRMMLIHI